MVERGHRARLLLEAPQPVLVARQRSGQYFDGDLALQAAIARSIDFSHPARAHKRENLIRPKLHSGCQWHKGGIITQKFTAAVIPLCRVDDVAQFWKSPSAGHGPARDAVLL